METTIFSTPVPSSTLLTSRWTSRPKHSRHLISVSLLKPSPTKTEAMSIATKTVYKDNFFEHLAIDYLFKAVQDTVGMRNEESGYESLVVAARAVFLSFEPIQQRELVVKALQYAIPGPLSVLIKTLFPPSKFSREYFAAFTTIFFPWLVGPCEVKESEFEGSKERNIVHIKKCRFLETANCAGMCTNLCKIPSQEFVKTSFGMPMNMVPNFDDMSCEMIFGQNPPALQDDPVLKQPCYKLCNVKHKHDTSCITKGHEEMEQTEVKEYINTFNYHQQ
ncbi:beta-carotene isomerase D27, chloroplastic-like [Bidens hawaiensis]|uniref:beta-carotene isomerase D27, chloroplastic-like n=1 Tax=Bidens hawaiensis TaxID=980011 RepID=UPI00404A617D